MLEFVSVRVDPGTRWNEKNLFFEIRDTVARFWMFVSPDCAFAFMSSPRPDGRAPKDATGIECTWDGKGWLNSDGAQHVKISAAECERARRRNQSKPKLETERTRGQRRRNLARADEVGAFIIESQAVANFLEM